MLYSLLSRYVYEPEGLYPVCCPSDGTTDGPRLGVNDGVRDGRFVGVT